MALGNHVFVHLHPIIERLANGNGLYKFMPLGTILQPQTSCKSYLLANLADY